VLLSDGFERRDEDVHRDGQRQPTEQDGHPEDADEPRDDRVRPDRCFTHADLTKQSPRSPSSGCLGPDRLVVNGVEVETRPCHPGAIDPKDRDSPGQTTAAAGGSALCSPDQPSRHDNFRYFSSALVQPARIATKLERSSRELTASIALLPARAGWV
jgi:hypothetical protein